MWMRLTREIIPDRERRVLFKVGAVGDGRKRRIEA